MAAFWEIAPYSLVEAGQRIRAANCFLHQGDRPVAALMLTIVMAFIFICSLFNGAFIVTKTT
jgi:hypothetical protein